MTQRDSGGTSGAEGNTRYTVTEAAHILGVGTDAIRKRIQRDTIAHERIDGTVYVWLDTDEPRHDTGVTDGGTEAILAAYRDQLDTYRDQVEFLRRELERKGAILLNMTEGLKALQAPSETRESDLMATPGEEGVEVEKASPEQEKRSWWHRLLGA